MTNKPTFNFWSAFGKFALIVTVLWTVTQIYNSYIGDNGFDFVALGKNSKYRLAPDHQEFIEKYKNLQVLDKTYREKIDPTGLSINKLIDFSEKTKNSEFLDRYEFNKKYAHPFEVPEYNNSWEFQIDNNGKKPLENLILETPFNGVYRITIKDKKDIVGIFNKNIELPDLNPGYSTGVRIWINELTEFDIYDEEKTRITHKYGFKAISYPKEVGGFIKWLTSYDYVPLQFGFFVLIVLFFFTFLGGLSYYPKFAENEKRRKIEEFLKNEELRKQIEQEVKKKAENQNKENSESDL